MNDRVCRYRGVEPVYWAGEFMENAELRCRLIADPGEELCPRHKLMVAQNLPVPDRFGCTDCGKKFKDVPAGAICPECGCMDFEEFPVEVPL